MTVTEGAAPTDQEVATPSADAAEGATQAAETTKKPAAREGEGGPVLKGAAAALATATIDGALATGQAAAAALKRSGQRADRRAACLINPVGQLAPLLAGVEVLFVVAACWRWCAAVEARAPRAPTASAD